MQKIAIPSDFSFIDVDIDNLFVEYIDNMIQI